MDVKIAAELLTDYSPAEVKKLVESKEVPYQYQDVPVAVWREAGETAYLCCVALEADPLWCLRMYTYLRRAYPYRVQHWTPLLGLIRDNPDDLASVETQIRRELHYGLFVTAPPNQEGAVETYRYIKGEMQALEAMLTVEPNTNQPEK